MSTISLLMALALYLVAWSATGGVVLFFIFLVLGHGWDSAIALTLLIGLTLIMLLRLSMVATPAIFFIQKLYPGVQLLPLGHPLWEIAERIALRHNMNAPDIYVVPSRYINGYAMDVGRGPAVVITDGALDLPTQEQAFILAHEMAHIHYTDAAVLSLQGDMAVARYVGQSIYITLHNMMRPLPWVMQAVPLLMRLWYRLSLFIIFLSGFIITPLFRLVSRRQELRADRFAAAEIGAQASITFLSRLSDHWKLYPYRTHPTARQRIEAVTEAALCGLNVES